MVLSEKELVISAFLLSLYHFYRTLRLATKEDNVCTHHYVPNFRLIKNKCFQEIFMPTGCPFNSSSIRNYADLHEFITTHVL